MNELATLESFSPPGVTGKWTKTPYDSTIADAAVLLQEYRRREQVIIDLEESAIASMVSIAIAPEWQRYRLVRAGQIPSDSSKRQRGGSVHAVGFGNLEIRNGTGTKPISVAVKPYERPDQAYLELRHTAIVRARGIPTINPIGALFSAERSFLFTLAEDVQTLDLEPWHQMTYERPEVRKHFLGRLATVADVLATLHLRGIRHGDPQLKNFWVKPHGQVEPIDFESSQVLDDPPSVEELLMCARKDLSKLKLSLTVPNADFPFKVISGSSDEVITDQFARYILDPYLDIISTERPEIIEEVDQIYAI